MPGGVQDRVRTPRLNWSPSPNCRTDDDFRNTVKLALNSDADAGIRATKIALQTRGWHTSPTGTGFRGVSHPASHVSENTACIFNSFAGFAREKGTSHG